MPVSIDNTIVNNGDTVTLTNAKFDLTTGQIIASGGRTSGVSVSVNIIYDPDGGPTQMFPGGPSYPSDETWTALWLNFTQVADGQVLRCAEITSPYGSVQVTVDVS